MKVGCGEWRLRCPGDPPLRHPPGLADRPPPHPGHLTLIFGSLIRVINIIKLIRSGVFWDSLTWYWGEGSKQGVLNLMFIFQGHYQLLLVLYLCVYSISLVLEVLIILVSLRGSVINSEPRRHIRPLIYVRQGLLTGELLLLVYSAKVKWRIYWIFIDQLIQWMLLIFGSERSLRSADVVSLSVCLSVCLSVIPHYALKLF